MAISVFDLFTIGIGPSSSHTVGPMRAAIRFGEQLEARGVLSDTARVRVELFGSLGLTGRGHGTDKAVILGLQGERPESVDPDRIPGLLEAARASRRLSLLGRQPVDFDPEADLVLHREQSLPHHPNGLRFCALSASGGVLAEEEYYSIGGGFVVEGARAGRDQLDDDDDQRPHPFHSAAELLERCAAHGLSISDVELDNEKIWRSEPEIRKGLLEIWTAMQQCVERGCRSDGVLPGRMGVRRRAPEIYRSLTGKPEISLTDPLTTLDWVNLYALAVNEENAAGGRVVTAPTNGAAGIVPAVLHYYDRFCPGSTRDGVIRFLLCAGAIGVLYKENASISGAEVGCQGEVGVACSMAAAGLAEALGGSPAQVENAAEIGMEHNLGLTCDPVDGLVQIPCIERNAMGAIKAINAARLALRGDGQHCVSLDRVIATMRQTGADMMSIYKETSQGGLAVNVTEC